MKTIASQIEKNPFEQIAPPSQELSLVNLSNQPEAQRGGGHTNGGHGNNSSPPSQNHSAPAQQRLPSPPATPAPSAINRTPAPPAISAHPQNPERRKVGRPRKEVHG